MTTSRSVPEADNPAPGSRVGSARERGEPATGRPERPVRAAGEPREKDRRASRGRERPGDDRRTSGRRKVVLSVAISGAMLLVAMVAAVAIGPVAIPLREMGSTLLAHVPGLGFHSGVPSRQQAIIWELRLPRVVLAALVGAMLAGGGAAYQGVLRNSLADPYLLGVAGGAGLGATIVIVAGYSGSFALPLAAFAGALAAVALTYVVASAGPDRAGSNRAGSYAIILAGVAVAAMLTAVQTYLQQQHTEQIKQIYMWILGSFSVATWSDVGLIAPYVAVCAIVLLAHRRILDVLRVGGDEAATLGVHPGRSSAIVIAAATLGTAAAVSVSGLIGFVGIVAPHAVRLAVGASYRVVMPVAMIGGAAFLVLADLAARTIEAPSEIPIGVVTAFVGGPFFLVVLRSRRSRHGVL